MVKRHRQRLNAIGHRVRWESLRVKHAAGPIACGLVTLAVIIAAADMFYLSPMRDRLAFDVQTTRRQLEITREWSALHRPQPASKPSASPPVPVASGPAPTDIGIPLTLHAILQSYSVDVRETTYDFKPTAPSSSQSDSSEVVLTMPLAGDYPAIRGALDALLHVPNTRLIDISIIRSQTTDTRLAVQLRLAYAQVSKP